MATMRPAPRTSAMRCPTFGSFCKSRKKPKICFDLHNPDSVSRLPPATREVWRRTELGRSRECVRP